MGVRIVRLGAPRAADEGLRLGTVRRPPRGVPKSEFSRRDFYDVWLPMLSPTPDLIALAKSAGDAEAWRSFKRKFRSEMRAPEPSQILDLLAVLSRGTNFSLGCYCESEAHCHRGLLRELLAERGAKFSD